MKRMVLAVMLIGSLGLSFATADIKKIPPTQIDTNTLADTRLFFSVKQRLEGSQSLAQGSTSHQAVKPIAENQQRKPVRPEPINSATVLRYTGVVHSDRGVQILLNGLPWLPGQLAVVSVRLQPSTQMIELKTINGVLHRLLPGDSVETKQ